MYPKTVLEGLWQAFGAHWEVSGGLWGVLGALEAILEALITFKYRPLGGSWGALGAHGGPCRRLLDAQDRPLGLQNRPETSKIEFVLRRRFDVSYKRLFGPLSCDFVVDLGSIFHRCLS